MIKRRHCFHIAGYDPASPAEQYQRFLRQLEIFKRTWGLEASTSDMSVAAAYPSWSVKTRGSNWDTHSIVEALAWDDLVHDDARRSRLIRIARAFAAYGNLLVSGTLVRYLLANTRYFMFAIVPIAETALFAIVGWWVCDWLAGALGAQGVVRTSLALLGGLVVMLGLLEWPGRRWRIYQALDDWVLSLDYIYGRRADLEARLNQFTARIAACARDQDIDEILIVGHSLGATFAVDVVARLLESSFAPGRRSPSLAIVTVGATIPKCVLHPAADWIRRRVRNVATNSSVYWAEYQARADPISFYRFNPVTMRRFEKNEDTTAGVPVIRILQMQDMLRSETFAKYRYRVLRLHYQFVSANDRVAPYDYFMMVCGPLPTNAWTVAPRGLLEFFDEKPGAALLSSVEQVS